MDTITDEIKNEIAEYFISDSKEFLFRYRKLREFQTQISNRSKLMIDLMFSIECSLKALIFIESKEDEKLTYKKIRIHDLKKLSDLIIDQSGLLGLEQSIIQSSEIYKVTSRYTLEANISFRESNILGALYYDTIADFVWLDKLYDVATDVLNFAESKCTAQLKVISFSDIDLDSVIEKVTRISNISKP